VGSIGRSWSYPRLLYHSNHIEVATCNSEGSWGIPYCIICWGALSRILKSVIPVLLWSRVWCQLKSTIICTMHDEEEDGNKKCGAISNTE